MGRSHDASSFGRRLVLFLEEYWDIKGKRCFVRCIISRSSSSGSIIIIIIIILVWYRMVWYGEKREKGRIGLEYFLLSGYRDVGFHEAKEARLGRSAP